MGKKTRRTFGCHLYLWLIIGLFILLALGILFLIAGIETGSPPFPPSVVSI